MPLPEPASENSSRNSVVHDAYELDSLGLQEVAVVTQTPEGMPVVESKPVQEIYRLFENLLAESIDAQAPGFNEAVQSLTGWLGREEETRVRAADKILNHVEKLREQNEQLNTEMAETLAMHAEEQDLRETVKKLTQEREEYRNALNDMEADLLEKINENGALLETIQKLKTAAAQQPKPVAPPAGETDPANETSPGPGANDMPPLIAMTPEAFVTSKTFIEETIKVEDLLRRDIQYVNLDKELLVGWTDSFQATVNDESERCAELKPWRNDGRLFHSHFTVFHVAAITGSADMVRGWLENGADVCACDRRGNNILHLCLMAEHMREVGLGFSDSEEISIVTVICDRLRETRDVRSLLTLMFGTNASGLYFMDDCTGELHSDLQEHRNSVIPMKIYFEEALEHILLHEFSNASLNACESRIPTSITCGVRVETKLYQLLASASLLPQAASDKAKSFKNFINLDQKKDSLLSYRVTRPELRFGDESQLSYTMLGCDQLGYAKVITPAPNLIFSTVGTTISVSPTIERFRSHIVIVENAVYISPPFHLSQSGVNMAGGSPSSMNSGPGTPGLVRQSSTVATPMRLSKMRKFNLDNLELLHLMEGYESMVLLRFCHAGEEKRRSSARSSASRHRMDEEPPLPVYQDLILETKYKPHLVLALCVHYYTYCKPPIPLVGSGGQVDVQAVPLKVDLNQYQSVPVFNGSATPEAIVVQTRFPQSSHLGEIIVVSTRSTLATSRYLTPFKKLGTVYFIPSIEEWIAEPFFSVNSQPAVCILHHYMTLELFAAPTDYSANALYRIDLDYKTRLVNPIALNSFPSKQSQGVLSRIAGLLDTTAQPEEKEWYAIEFQEKNSAHRAAAIGFSIKQERDDWMCLLYHRQPAASSPS